MRWECGERDAQLPPGTVRAKPRAHHWHLEVPRLHPHWIICVPLGNVLSLRFVTWRLRAAASAWRGRGGQVVLSREAAPCGQCVALLLIVEKEPSHLTRAVASGPVRTDSVGHRGGQHRYLEGKAGEAQGTRQSWVQLAALSTSLSVVGTFQTQPRDRVTTMAGPRAPWETPPPPRGCALL